MKIISNILLAAVFVAGLSVISLAQVQTPRPSQRAEVSQTIGDAKIALVYHRPSINGRKVWGELVPYGEVWRMGANENTTFEVSEAVKINGSELPAGKYGLHAIPNKDEWIIIFNKVNNEWGSFKYDVKQDQLRVKIKPQSRESFRETMAFTFDTATPTTTELVLTWEKLRLPIMIDVGDVQSRMVKKLRDNVAKSNTGDDAKIKTGARMLAANYILENKIAASYPEAAVWIDEALKMGETFSTLRAKARISAVNGNYKDAVMYGDKAIAAGKTMGAAMNAEFLMNFEKDVAGWKTKM